MNTAYHLFTQLRCLYHLPSYRIYCLGRSEKKVLNGINSRGGEGSLKYFLPDANHPNRRKERIATPPEKIYLLVRFPGQCVWMCTTK